MHRLQMTHQTDLWYDEEYTMEDLLKGWDNILEVRFSSISGDSGIYTS